MVMGNTVSLSNGRSWTSQKAAAEHFRQIRNRYADDVVIDDAQDHEDLLALLERYDAAHGEEDSKIGLGVDFFVVRTNYGSGGPTRGFWVHRINESVTDFSFLWAIRGIPKPQAQEFADACRSAVDRELKIAKRRFFETYADANGLVPCELTDVPLSFETAHVDHAHPSFGALVITFRAARGWHADIPAGTLSKAADSQLITTFVDPAVAEAFRGFHRGSATLRMVAPGANLSRAAGQRRPKIARPVRLAD
jgi:hypothetical protein